MGVNGFVERSRVGLRLMCSAVVLPDGRRLLSLGDLRECWQVLPTDLYGGGENYYDDSCLCIVDVNMVLARAGVEWVDDMCGDCLVEGL